MMMDHEFEPSDLTDDEKEAVGMPGDLVSEEVVPSRARSTTVMISLRIDRPVFDELSRLAEEGGRTLSETARDALRSFVRGQRGSRSYPIAASARVPSRKVSESTDPTWTDDDLRSALERYEGACRRAEMRDNAWRSYVDYARRFLAWRTGDYRPRGTMSNDRPVPRSLVTTAELRRQADHYAQQVHAAGREQPTVDTYFRHAMFFIRWLEGEFEPGARLRGLR